MATFLKDIGPYIATLVVLVVGILTWLNGRKTNTINSQNSGTQKYALLDNKQEQIAEWGFVAAEEANARADRIATEAKEQVANLQRQLDELKRTLQEQVGAMERVRAEHKSEIEHMIATHEAEIGARDRAIASLTLRISRLEGTPHEAR